VDYAVKNTFVELLQTPLGAGAPRSSSLPPMNLARPVLGAMRREPSVESCKSDEETPDFNLKRMPCGPFDRGYNKKYEEDTLSECSDCSNATADLFNEDKPRRKLRAAARSLAFAPKERVAKSAPTTLMVRNLPIRTTVRQIFQYLDDHGLVSKYDFLHFPVDMRTRMHTGYAFVNFVDASAAEFATEVLQGTQIAGSTSKKIISVCPAARQGVDANMVALEKSCQLPKSSKTSKRSKSTIKPPELPWVRCDGGSMKQIAKW
jgi:hypothetical protein